MEAPNPDPNRQNAHERADEAVPENRLEPLKDLIHALAIERGGETTLTEILDVIDKEKWSKDDIARSLVELKNESKLHFDNSWNSSSDK